MTVYCVFEHDWEGSYLKAIHATEAAAEAHAERLNDLNRPLHQKGVKTTLDRHSVENWEVSE